MRRLLLLVVALLAVDALAQAVPAEINIVFSPKVDVTTSQELHCAWNSNDKVLVCVTIDEYLELVRKLERKRPKKGVVEM